MNARTHAAGLNHLTTAFVLAGGGSLGAVQVGMLRSLTAHGIRADMVVGSSVGSINGAYFAGRPDAAGVAALEQLWRAMRRPDIFPIGMLSLARFAWQRDYLVDPQALSSLIERNLPYRRLEEARVPVHVVTTDFLTGATVVHSSGTASRAILASCAIPAAFRPVMIGAQHLVDGGIASNTPVRIAIKLGAKRLIVLPTGYSCALRQPPLGAIASALHGLTLLIAGQLVGELETIDPTVEFHVVPSLCPVTVSAYDFSQTADLIERAADQTNQWIEAGGMQNSDIPATLRPHSH